MNQQHIFKKQGLRMGSYLCPVSNEVHLQRISIPAIVPRYREEIVLNEEVCLSPKKLRELDDSIEKEIQTYSKIKLKDRI